jgi:hypothetical protein
MERAPLVSLMTERCLRWGAQRMTQPVVMESQRLRNSTSVACRILSHPTGAGRTPSPAISV